MGVSVHLPSDICHNVTRVSAVGKQAICKQSAGKTSPLIPSTQIQWQLVNAVSLTDFMYNF